MIANETHRNTTWKRPPVPLGAALASSPKRSLVKALVTGATGFVGRRLLAELDTPAILSRSAARAADTLAGFNVNAFTWDGEAERPPLEAFEGVETIFHLAGEPIADGRWAAEKKRRMVDSRVLGTRHLVEAIAALDDKPKTLISASAVGYYGSCRDRELTEDAPAGDDFVAELAVKWEAEAARAVDLGVRVVRLRIGLVLGREGGALAKMLPPFKLGLGAWFGSGRQWMPWIHVDDVVCLMLHAATDGQLVGPVNAVAPSPATNRDFSKALGRALNRPVLLSAPVFMLRAVLGEFADVLLASQRVLPQAALDAGYQFSYPRLDAALQDVLK